VADERLIPILRVENATDAVAWYQRLGFALQFEHSRGPGFGRTDAVLTRGKLRLILSQGDGDVPRDGVVCLQVAEIDGIAKEFNAEIRNEFLRKQVDLRDPSGNRVRVIALERIPPRMGPRAHSS
jgi:hypothetical protein